MGKFMICSDCGNTFSCEYSRTNVNPDPERLNCEEWSGSNMCSCGSCNHIHILQECKTRLVRNPSNINCDINYFM